MDDDIKLKVLNTYVENDSENKYLVLEISSNIDDKIRKDILEKKINLVEYKSSMRKN